MPRIFRARPAPPVGRSINIGVTMRPIAPRPAAQLPIVENGVAPAYVGFADPPVANYFATAEDGSYYYYADFYGVTPDGVTGFGIADTGEGDPVTPNFAEPLNTGLIFNVLPFTGAAIISVTAVNDDTEYTARFEIAPPP